MTSQETARVDAEEALEGSLLIGPLLRDAFLREAARFPEVDIRLIDRARVDGFFEYIVAGHRQAVLDFQRALEHRRILDVNDFVR